MQHNSHRDTVSSVLILFCRLFTVFSLAYLLKYQKDKVEENYNKEINSIEYTKIIFLKKIILEKKYSDVEYLTDLYINDNIKNWDYLNKYKLKTLIENNDSKEVKNLLNLINKSYEDKIINYYEYNEITNYFYTDIIPYNVLTINKEINENLLKNKEILEKK